MYEDLTPEEIDKYYETLYNFNEDPTYVWKISGWGKMDMTSANLMDTSLVAALRSAIGNNQDGIAAAVAALGTATGYATGAEGDLDGFYEDGSCIQHSNLAYTGGYGVALLKGIEKLLLLSNGTASAAPGREAEHRIFLDLGRIPPALRGRCRNGYGQRTKHCQTEPQ